VGNEQINQKYLKLNKRHEELLDKIRETTKSPIQEIRKELLAVVDTYAKIQKPHAQTRQRADSPLGELNRIRGHLEDCLKAAVSSGEKIEEKREKEVKKRNSENSSLLLEINNMRKLIRELEDVIKEKDLKIGRLMRGEAPPPLPNAEKKAPITETETK
jgi:hypothetical protein